MQESDIRKEKKVGGFNINQAKPKDQNFISSFENAKKDRLQTQLREGKFCITAF